jgi:hypothetical protein
VAKFLRLASKENNFYGHPVSSGYANIKLKECAVIAVNFFCGRSEGATLRMAARVGGALAYMASKIAEYFRSEPRSSLLEHGFNVRES